MMNVSVWMRAIGFASFLALAGCAADTPDPEHTSQNSLDWAGVYHGVMPCADCPGIETYVTLNTNQSFSTRYRYLERSGWLYTVGKFEWNKTGSAVMLNEGDNRFSNYHVGEGRLTALDLDGNWIEGPIAPHLILKKIR
jgi:copper homeostasis protein (lipoprotein)